jgi:hypothetical protein
MSDTGAPFDAIRFRESAVATLLPKLEIARVVKATARLIGQNWLAICATIFVIAILPKLLFVAVQLIFEVAIDDEMKKLSPLSVYYFSTDFLAPGLSQLIISFLLLNREASRFVTLKGVIALLFPMFLLKLYLSFGVSVGLVLLIVPGIILMKNWSVAVPVLIGEGLEPTAAMRRSTDLVEGYSWKVLAVVAVAALIEFFWSKGLAQVVSTFGSLWFEQLGDQVLSALLSPWGALINYVLPIALYREIVALKEGEPADEIADVFD